jgi:hypothetical protein
VGEYKIYEHRTSKVPKLTGGRLSDDEQAGYALGGELPYPIELNS